MSGAHRYEEQCSDGPSSSDRLFIVFGPTEFIGYQLCSKGCVKCGDSSHHTKKTDCPEVATMQDPRTWWKGATHNAQVNS